MKSNDNKEASASLVSKQYEIFHFQSNTHQSIKRTNVLGQPVNVARYDQQKHDVFEKLTEKQLSFFWRPEEMMSVKIKLTSISCHNMNSIFLYPI